ncbi:MAG: RNA polymerase sigma factor [Gemmataceae bacterium]
MPATADDADVAGKDPTQVLASQGIEWISIITTPDAGEQANGKMVAMPAFRSTRWSLIGAARDLAEPSAQRALAELCEIYWYPAYAYIRRRGYNPDLAQDLTQGFFAGMLQRGFSGADPDRGRFRNYLLGACRHFLANEYDRANADKRGGGKAIISLDFPDAERRYAAEPIDERTPDQLFDRRWALMLLQGTLETLRLDYQQTGSAELFNCLASSLTGEGASYAAIAQELGMTEGAVKVAAHRLRLRYRETLRAAIADTVNTPAEVDDEIRCLFQALGS